MITGQPESLLTEIVGNSRTLGQNKLDKRETGIFWLLFIATRDKVNQRYSKWTQLIPTPGFPGDSDSKESACNSGGSGSSLRSGKSPGEGNGYPLQYSCLENSSPWDRRESDTTEQLTGASQVALGKKLPVNTRDTWVRSLGQEDALEEGMATHSSILAWRIPWTEESGELQLWGHKELDTTEYIIPTPLPQRLKISNLELFKRELPPHHLSRWSGWVLFF